MNYISLADRILNGVGGRENISFFDRCMSRLRFIFKNKELVDFDELKKIREIRAVVRRGEEFCLVVKKDLSVLYNAVKEELDSSHKNISRGRLKHYIRYYRWIIFFLIIAYATETIAVVGAERRLFSVLLITALLSFAAGVSADILLRLIKIKDNEFFERGIELLTPLKGRIVKSSGRFIENKNTVLIYPELNAVFSPVDGWVEEVYRTKHAVLIRSNMGFGVLIHIGVDTVYAGEGCFSLFVQKGEPVSKGEIILEFDADTMLENGYDLTSAVEIIDCDASTEAKLCSDYAVEGRVFLRLLDR